MAGSSFPLLDWPDWSQDRGQFQGIPMRVVHDLAESTRCVEDLREQFIRRIADPGCSTAETAGLFLTHRASVIKLRTAVGLRVRSAGCDDATREDLFSEARLNVLASFRLRRDLGYDASLGRFDSWLYSVWHNAVSYAFRTLHRGPKVEFWSNEQLERESSSNGRSLEDGTMFGTQEFLKAVSEMRSSRMQEVMLDWASGLSGADSARMRDISEARVSELRTQGVAIVRERLGLTPPHRPR